MSRNEEKQRESNEYDRVEKQARNLYSVGLRSAARRLRHPGTSFFILHRCPEVDLMALIQFAAIIIGGWFVSRSQCELARKIARLLSTGHRTERRSQKRRESASTSSTSSPCRSLLPCCLLNGGGIFAHAPERFQATGAFTWASLSETCNKENIPSLQTNSWRFTCWFQPASPPLSRIIFLPSHLSAR